MNKTIVKQLLNKVAYKTDIDTYQLNEYFLFLGSKYIYIENIHNHETEKLEYKYFFKQIKLGVNHVVSEKT